MTPVPQQNPLFQTVRPFILASASPRRRNLLAGLGLVFEVATADVDETPRSQEAPAAFVSRIAAAKARAVARQHLAAWVLAADTVVVLDDAILGKPKSAEDAVLMLQRLSGRRHEVWTGFCLCHPQEEKPVTRAVRTEVHFAPLAEEICRAYVRTGEPLDKAGGYGIQGKGGVFVREISGSYSNVVGLPLAEVVTEFLRLGIIRPISA